MWSNPIKLILLGDHKASHEIQIVANGLINHFFTNNRIKKDIKFDDDPFQGIIFIGIFFSHKKSIFFFEDMLDFTDNMRPPNNFPILVGILCFFFHFLLQIIQSHCRFGFDQISEQTIFCNNLCPFLKNLFLAS